MIVDESCTAASSRTAVFGHGMYHLEVTSRCLFLASSQIKVTSTWFSQKGVLYWRFPIFQGLCGFGVVTQPPAIYNVKLDLHQIFQLSISYRCWRNTFCHNFQNKSHLQPSDGVKPTPRSPGFKYLNLAKRGISHLDEVELVDPLHLSTRFFKRLVQQIVLFCQDLLGWIGVYGSQAEKKKPPGFQFVFFVPAICVQVRLRPKPCIHWVRIY